MNRPSTLAAVCLLLAGCPFTPEDLELTAGSPALGTGGPAGPQGGPMSEPDLNALVPAQTQEELLATAHRMLRGTVEGTCAVSVRIDVLQGPPAPGDAGAPTDMAHSKEPADGSGALSPTQGGKPEPGAGDAAGADRQEAAPPTKPGPTGADPGGPPDGQKFGPLTTLQIERPGPFAIATPVDRSLRLVALCDGNEDGYLTHSDDRISPPTDLGVPKEDQDGLLLVLAEPQMPGSGGPGGPPGGGPGGPPGGGPGGPPGGDPGGPPGGGPGGSPAGGPPPQ